MNLELLTSEVCKIAKTEGLFLSEERKVFNRNKVEEKNAHDYVSYVDKETEKLLVNKLSELLHQAGFITEEETVEFTENEYCWVIDPLDGTTNFIHDNAPYCVSIALTYQSMPIIGVIYEVCRNECFYAWKGGKAYMNGKQILVSTTADMNKSLVGLDLPYDDKQYKPIINHLMDSLYGKVSSIRMNGSAAMSLCYVAIGRFDMWVEAYIKSWDFMAGALIVQEAGGMVTDYAGDSNFVKGHHIVATNGLLHTEALSLVSPFIDSL